MDAGSQIGKAGIDDKCGGPITAVGDTGARRHISGEMHMNLEWRSLDMANVETADMLKVSAGAKFWVITTLQKHDYFLH